MHKADRAGILHRFSNSDDDGRGIDKHCFPRLQVSTLNQAGPSRRAGVGNRRCKSDTPRRAGGLMSWAASEAVESWV